MNATIKNVLKSSIAFSALCSSVVACGPGGGGGGGYNPNNSYRSSNLQRPVFIRPAVQTPTASGLQSTTSVAPVARISEVTATEAPVAKIQLASAVEEKPVVKPEVKKPEPPKDDSELKNTLDAINGGSDEVAQKSPISDAMKGLVGTWMAVARQGEGELSTIELQLDDNGTAKLTVPGKDGTTKTTTRKVNFDNKELKLIGGDSDITLGKLVEFDARQLVLDRDGRQMTFVRPN
jgi:hypothetical protein